MTDEQSDFSRKKRISITDEFSELMLLRPETLDDDRDRVVDAVLQRIRTAPVDPEPENLLFAISAFAKPAIAIAVPAALIFVFATRTSSGDRPAAAIQAPSTAQALGLSSGIARWSDQRDRAPQLLEVAVDLRATVVGSR